MPKITPTHYKKLIKFFEAKGFCLVRQRGDHLIFVKAGIIRPIVIPTYKEIPVFIIKNNLAIAQIDREEYLKFFNVE